MEIQLKGPKKFSSLFLMMGTFHVLLMSLGVIGARFKDAGMKDLYIQSEIIAEGSIDSVLKGKQYNRTIRTHKIGLKPCDAYSWKHLKLRMVSLNSDIFFLQ